MPDIFNRFTIVAGSENVGRQLDEFQHWYYHNLRADKAQDLLLLPFDATDIIKYAQQEAYLQGQIELLTAMLEVDPTETQSNVTKEN